MDYIVIYVTEMRVSVLRFVLLLHFHDTGNPEEDRTPRELGPVFCLLIQDKVRRHYRISFGDAVWMRGGIAIEKVHGM